MILFKNNLKTGKFEITPEKLAEGFLNSDSEVVGNVKNGWPILRGLLIYIGDELGSMSSNIDYTEELEKTRLLISEKIKYKD